MKNKKTRRVLNIRSFAFFCFLALAIISGLAFLAEQSKAEKTSQVEIASSKKNVTTLPFLNPDLPLEARVSDLVSRLTLEEKVGQ
ncbi:MAG TPA: hypothetical protein PLW30_06835, partial [Candidatus Saccharicenans sp.]|nr:hypothetical protein [Candidatus Saccharicenans sp.]